MGPILDLLITNGILYDGTENPPMVFDLAIHKGKIVSIGKNLDSNRQFREIIDAHQKIVCPGFIDMHSHCDQALFFGTSLECMVRQGITTSVMGNCGSSMAPILPESKPRLLQNISRLYPEMKNKNIPWTTFAEYLHFLELQGVPLNFIPLVGFGILRSSVLGYDNRPPTSSEMAQMQGLLREAMEAGAYGLSTGLMYAPQVYATTEEIIELAKIVAPFGGYYFSHIRNQDIHYLESVQELIRIVEESGVKGGQVSHLKPGRPSGGSKIPYLQAMEQANQRGLMIRGDQYPYLRSSNGLKDQLPPWALEGDTDTLLNRIADPHNQERIFHEMDSLYGSFEEFSQKIFLSIVNNPDWKQFEGQSLAKVAKSLALSPFSVYCKLLLEDHGTTAITKSFGNEDDYRQILQHPLVMIGTDGSGHKFGEGKPHPRSYGTYPRVLAYAVREKHYISLTTALRKMTSLPAQTLGLWDRGTLRVGNWADIVIFDPDTVQDHATYHQPHQYPSGIETVIVNGTPLLKATTWMDASHAGRILRLSSFP